MSAGDIQQTVRLAPDLLEWLRADAQAYGRTVPQSIRWYLERCRKETTSES